MKVRTYLHLMRLNKPIPIFLILWPTLTALAIALNGKFNISLYAIFFLGVITMRTFGCIINDIADRKFDINVERTQFRPLAIGSISIKSAFIILFFLFFIALFLVLLLNIKTILLSFVALFLTVLYPFCKRFFFMPQLVLGLTFNFGILMVFTATSNEIPLVAWLLYLASASWTVAYDTFYALADRDYDIKIGLNSSAVTMGKYVFIGILCAQIIALIFWILAGNMLKFSVFYYTGLLFILLYFLLQFRHADKPTLERCIRMFSNNHWVGLVIFFLVNVELHRAKITYFFL